MPADLGEVNGDDTVTGVAEQKAPVRFDRVAQHLVVLQQVCIAAASVSPTAFDPTREHKCHDPRRWSPPRTPAQDVTKPTSTR